MFTSTREFAVVTGGSNGIGYELARQFLENAFDVLITGEDPAHLAEALQGLGGIGAGEATSFASDLSTEAGVGQLIAEIERSGRAVDAVCINAGFGLGGAFAETDLDRELKMIDLNCRGAVQLAKRMVVDMVARDRGRILFTSSIAATMPDPFEAVYGATKVFLRWFGEALHNELKDTGVSVTVLMPSVTDTDFFNRAEMLDTKAGASDRKDDPAMVAAAGFKALMKGKDQLVPSLKNKAIAATADALPGKVAAQVHRGMSEPGSGEG